ncbi:MAG: hypothetical protein RIF32_17675 [Leptospirales bacterium]
MKETLRHTIKLAGCLLLAATLAGGCAKSRNGSPGTGGESGLPVAESQARAIISPDACEARGGVIIGDPGDGRIHRPKYLCPSGKPPLAAVRYETGDMIPVEGSVCCPG